MSAIVAMKETLELATLTIDPPGAPYVPHSAQIIGPPAPTPCEVRIKIFLFARISMLRLGSASRFFPHSIHPTRMDVYAGGHNLACVFVLCLAKLTSELRFRLYKGSSSLSGCREWVRRLSERNTLLTFYGESVAWVGLQVIVAPRKPRYRHP